MHRRRQQGKEPLKEKSPNIDSVTRPLPQLPVAPGSAGGHPPPRGSAMATALEGCGWLLGLIPLFSHRSRSITVPAPFALCRDAGAGKRGQVVREGGCETLPKAWRTETSRPTAVPTARGCLGTSRVGIHGTAPELPDAVGTTAGPQGGGGWEFGDAPRAVHQ